jgi:hypothetical protein
VLLYHLVTNDYPVKGHDAGRDRGRSPARQHKSLRDARPDLPQSFVALVGAR